MDPNDSFYENVEFIKNSTHATASAKVASPSTHYNAYHLQAEQKAEVTAPSLYAWPYTQTRTAAA